METSLESNSNGRNQTDDMGPRGEKLNASQKPDKSITAHGNLPATMTIETSGLASPSSKAKDVNEATEMIPKARSRSHSNKQSTRQLRKMLKAYFCAAFRYKSGVAYINLLHCTVFLVQIIKVSLITTQMFRFGNDRSNFTSIVYKGQQALTHLMLKGWDASWETPSYPPAHGAFAVYTINDFEASVNYAVQRYHNAANEAIGFYLRGPNDKMETKVKYFDFPGFIDSDIQGHIDVLEMTLPTDKGLHCGNRTCTYDIRTEFTHHNLSRPFKRMLSLDLEFSLHSVRMYEHLRQALCLKITGTVGFTDLDNNGRVVMTINTLSKKIPCQNIGLNITDWSFENALRPFGTVVIAFCTLSLVIAIVSIMYSVLLFRMTKRYMRHHYQEFYNPLDTSENDLPAKEYRRFMRLWDFSLALSDVMTLYGTFQIFFMTEAREWVLANLDSNTVWLGLGCILAWLNLLRYFKFTKKFFLLFRTLHYAFWDVMAYVTCVSVLFIGFWVCGYVVMGPYHVKFSTPSCAMETLFALINGDEIYTTLAILETDKTGGNWVFWFSRIYIGFYIAIFTIVVINLLIALFMSAYDTIRNKDNPDNDADLGNLEKAMRKFLVSETAVSNSRLRSSFCDLMDESISHSTEEMMLKRELSKLVRVSGTQNDVHFRRPRTLKAFIEDKDCKQNVIRFCGLKFVVEVFELCSADVEKG